MKLSLKALAVLLVCCLIGKSYAEETVTIYNLTGIPLEGVLVRTQVKVASTKKAVDVKSKGKLLYDKESGIGVQRRFHIPKDGKRTIKNYTRNTSLYDRTLWVAAGHDDIELALSDERILGNFDVDSYVVGSSSTVYVTLGKDGRFKFSLTRAGAKLS